MFRKKMITLGFSLFCIACSWKNSDGNCTFHKFCRACCGWDNLANGIFLSHELQGVSSFGLFVGFFATARNFRKTRFIWIFCQDKELCEWSLCWLSNWRQKQWRADHTKFECKNWKSWARTTKIEMYKKFLSWTNAATSLPVNNRDAWVHRTPVFRCEFVSPGVYKGIFTRNLLDWPELWNATFRYP